MEKKDESQPTKCIFSNYSEIYFNDLCPLDNTPDGSSKYNICDGICLGLNVQHHHFLTTNDVNQSNKIYINRSYPYKYQDSAKLSEYCKNTALIIEKKEAICLPKSHHYDIYENKQKVYEFFQKTGVLFPTTFIITKTTNLVNIIESINFPIVVKHPFSCSSFGMNHLDDIYPKENLQKFLINELNKLNANNNCIIVQQKLYYTIEARLSCIGGKIFHGYYRRKQNKMQMSAASSEGGIIDFSLDINDRNLQKYAMDFYEKTNLDFCGIDIAWENDDMSLPPIALEVSPIFDLNPPPPLGITNYKDYKRTDLYMTDRIRQFITFGKEIKLYLQNRLNKPILFCDIDFTISDSMKRLKSNTTNLVLTQNAFSSNEVMKDLPYKYSVEANHILMQKYRIYFLTARGNFENAYDTTKQWLDTYNFHYDKLIVVASGEEKINVIKKYNADEHRSDSILIDDFTCHHEKEVYDINTNLIDKFKKENINIIKFEFEQDNYWNNVIHII
jgi:hypothetical protein